TSPIDVSAELRVLITACRESSIQLIIGSAVGAGARAHVDSTFALIDEIDRRDRLNLKVARIDAEIPKSFLHSRLAEAATFEFESGEELTEANIEESTRIVAQMGPEPIVAALEKQPDIVLAGRACDDALFSAFPIMRGLDAGLATHMGKVLECGALASEPIRSEERRVGKEC